MRVVLEIEDGFRKIDGRGTRHVGKDSPTDSIVFSDWCLKEGDEGIQNRTTMNWHGTLCGVNGMISVYYQMQADGHQSKTIEIPAAALTLFVRSMKATEYNFDC